MKMVKTLIAFVAVLLMSAASHAARPTVIVFQTHAETEDGRHYAQFNVRCNDGRTVPLTAWDERRTWCVGEVKSSETLSCEKKQISAAQSACMDA